MNESIVLGLTWLGVALCVSQSAMFSGLNLAFFSLSRLQLEIEAKTNARARRILEMRQDSHFLLTTILWGNVAVNVLLALLTDSVMTGVAAFFVSTFLITLLGEIAPQAYFSRNAMAMASLLAPLLRLYQRILWPVARPSARLLDAWLGAEVPHYLQESIVRDMLMKHVEAEGSEVDAVEGTGAANFLAIDDLTVWDEGEPLAPASIIALPLDVDLPRIPEVLPTPDDPFLKLVNASGEKWVVLTDEGGEPLLALDADGFLRGALFGGPAFRPYDFCHRPIVVRRERRSLGWVIKRLAQGTRRSDTGVIENDVVLVWGESPRIITGSDIFGRLLAGI